MGSSVRTISIPHSSISSSTSALLEHGKIRSTRRNSRVKPRLALFADASSNHYPYTWFFHSVLAWLLSALLLVVHTPITKVLLNLLTDIKKVWKDPIFHPVGEIIPFEHNVSLKQDKGLVLKPMFCLVFWHVQKAPKTPKVAVLEPMQSCGDTTWEGISVSNRQRCAITWDKNYHEKVNPPANKCRNANWFS